MAPRLPSAEDLGLPGSLESRRGIASFDTSALAKGADAIGRGALALGTGVIAFADKQKREGDQFEKAEADAAFIKDHTALLTEQARNPDPDAYRRESQAILQKAAERLGNPRERKLWELGKASQLAHGSSQVDGAAFRVAADSFGAGSQRAEDDAQEVLKNSADPAAHHQIMEAGAARYQEAARRGYITEQQAQAATKVFAARSMHTVLGQQPIDEQVAALQGPATDRSSAINRIEQVESNGNAAAKNPLSTATGAGQFTEGTWLATLKAHRPDLLEGRSREQVLALRNDRTLSREAIGYLYDDNLAALGAQGLPANPTTGYLSHFLGSGGAAAVLKAAPGTPVSDVLGDDQIAANRSILAGKTVDTVKVWAARKMGESPLSSGLQSLPADTRETWLHQAQSQLATQQREAQRAYHEQAGALQARMSDDLASIEATGQSNAQLRSEDVAQVLGPQAATDWLAQRGRSSQVHQALDGIGSLPEGEIERRLQTLEPKPGVDGFAEDMAAYTKARKRADALMQARRADPALAVETLPAVKEARAAAQYVDDGGKRQITPDSAQAIVRSRLATQSQLGIPEPMAVTKSEASVIARQLRSIGDDDTPGLKRFVEHLQGTYGDFADEVLASTIQHQNVNRDLAVAATEVLGKLGRGVMPTPSDQNRLERASTGQRMEDALAGRLPGARQGGGAAAPAAPAPLNFDPTTTATGTNYLDPQRQDAQPEAARPGEMQGAATGADLKALFEHRNDPTVLAEFDATYGQGTAQRTLAEIGRRLGTGGQR